MTFGLRGWRSSLALAAVLFVAACSPDRPAAPADTAAAAPASTPADTAAAAPAVTFEDKFKLGLVLLDADEVAPLIGSVPQMFGNTYFDIFVPAPGADYSNPGCTGALTPGMNTTFATSKYQFVAGQRLADGDVQGLDSTRNATQMLVSFPSVEDARSVIDAARPLWQACGGASMKRTDSDGQTVVTTMGEPVDTKYGLAMLNIAEGGDGWRCGRALGSYSSVVADVMVCGNEATTDQAVAVQEAIFRKIKV